MKVLLISKWIAGATKDDFYYPGVWRDTFELAKALKKQGCEVAILTPKTYPQHAIRFEKEFGYELTKMQISHFFANTFIGFGRDWGIFRFKLFLAELKALKKFNPDIVQYMQFGPSIIFPFVGKKPVIYYSCYLEKHYPKEQQDLNIKGTNWGPANNIITFIYFNFFNILYILLSSLIGARIFKDIFKKETIVVFMHKKGYQAVLHKYGHKKQLHYIQKGIDLNNQRINNFLSITKQTKKREYKRILFIGSILYGKGVFDLIAAFQKISRKFKAELIIIGAGPSSLIDKLTELIKLDKQRIFYLGSVDYFKKWEYFRSSDIFCLPSYHDSYPSVIFEAQIAGLPVITTMDIDSPIINNRNGILIKAGDIEYLKQALVRLLENEKSRFRMGEYSRKNVLLYSWQRAASNFCRLYSELIQKGETSAKK